MKPNFHTCEDADCKRNFNIHSTDERDGEITHIHYETFNGVTFSVSGVTIGGKKICGDCHEKAKKAKKEK